MIDPNKKPVDAINHSKESRPVIPTSELAGEEAMNVADSPKESRYSTFCHEFNRGRDPELYWLGKYDNDDDYYIFHCDESLEVVADDCFESIEACKRVMDKYNIEWHTYKN